MGESSEFDDEQATVGKETLQPSLHPGTWGALPVDGQPFQPRRARAFPRWILPAIGASVAVLVLAVAVVLTESQPPPASTASEFTLAVPSNIDGLSKDVDSAGFERAASDARSGEPSSPWSQTVAAIFTDRSSRSIKVIARHTKLPWRHASQAAYIRTFLADFKPDDDMKLAPMSRQPPGRLGGTVRCRAMSGSRGEAEICVAFNRETLVTMTDFSVGHERLPDPAMITTVREAFVRRAPARS